MPEEDDMVEAARRAVAAAEEASEAAAADASTSEQLRQLTFKVLEEAQSVLFAAEQSPRHQRKRQSLAEFTTMLSEEVKEATESTVQEGIMYAERTMTRAKSLIEDHFHIDEAFRMLGPLRQDSNLARDVHDWFNLIALLPVIWFNLKNWSCDSIFLCGLLHDRTIGSLWHGEAFMLFWMVTLTYFILDILWMLVLPHCVRSPGVIIKHHVVTLGYIMVPYMMPRLGWLMGSCMLVEVNTWFLIARRSFNKNGDKMFTTGVSVFKSLRVLFVSSCFYVSWFVIRLWFYPYLLVAIFREWWNYSIEVGNPLNLLTITPFMQCVFIFLNIKWTVDLIRSKMKSRGPEKGL